MNSLSGNSSRELHDSSVAASDPKATSILTGLPIELRHKIEGLLPGEDQMNLGSTCKTLCHTNKYIRTIRLNDERLSELVSKGSLFPPESGAVISVPRVVIDLRADGRTKQGASDIFAKTINTSPACWGTVREVIVILDTCNTIHESDHKEDHPVLSFMASLPSLQLLGFDRFDQTHFPWQEDNVLRQAPFLDRLDALMEISIRYTGNNYVTIAPQRSSSLPGVTVNLVCTAYDELGCEVGPMCLMWGLAATIRDNLLHDSTSDVNVVDATSILVRAAKERDFDFDGENKPSPIIDTGRGTVKAGAARALFESDQPVLAYGKSTFWNLSIPPAGSKKVNWIEETEYGSVPKADSYVGRFHSRANSKDDEGVKGWVDPSPSA